MNFRDRVRRLWAPGSVHVTERGTIRDVQALVNAVASDALTYVDESPDETTRKQREREASEVMNGLMEGPLATHIGALKTLAGRTGVN